MDDTNKVRGVVSRLLVKTGIVEKALNLLARIETALSSEKRESLPSRTADEAEDEDGIDEEVIAAILKEIADEIRSESRSALSPAGHTKGIVTIPYYSKNGLWHIVLPGDIVTTINDDSSGSPLFELVRLYNLILSTAFADHEPLDYDFIKSNYSDENSIQLMIRLLVGAENLLNIHSFESLTAQEEPCKLEKLQLTLRS